MAPSNRPFSGTRFNLFGLCFILGLAIFALIVSRAALSAKRLDEFVTVKGLSEREVPADLAIWPVTFTVADNELTPLLEQIRKSREAVHSFLLAQGFEPGEVSNAPPQIYDQTDTEDSGDKPKKPLFRYRANITVLLRSEKIAKLKSAVEACDQLVQQGVVLRGGGDSNQPQFLFNGLNKIKPEMIQEANRNARFAATKFADDSQAHVGAIKHAIQGPFEVNNVDSSSPDRKIVRVVTTVDFYLN
jgi:hypothetical protein